jgi:hypothetical protein
MSIALTAERDFSPLDEQLQLREAHWSEGVARLVTWLDGQGTFREVAEVLEKVGQIHISSSTTWREGQQWGEAFQQAEAGQAEQVNHLPSRDEIIPGEMRSSERMGAAMDGAMRYILGEGWKEFKTGCIFDILQQPTFDKETLEWEDLGHAAQLTYVAHLGGPEVLGQKLWAEAYRRHWTQAGQTQVLGDAAAWIWNLTEEHFYDSQQTVDWYHASEHLSNAAECLYGEENTPPKQSWLNEHKKLLFQGQAAQLALRLQHLASGQSGGVQEAVLCEAGYFEHNQHRMNYLELREEGWLIGSGMVESGAKQFKHRFTGPGMRWSRSGAERLLPVRAAVMSHNFDDVWRAIYNSPNN